MALYGWKHYAFDIEVKWSRLVPPFSKLYDNDKLPIQTEWFNKKHIQDILITKLK